MVIGFVSFFEGFAKSRELFFNTNKLKLRKALFTFVYISGLQEFWLFREILKFIIVV